MMPGKRLRNSAFESGSTGGFTLEITPGEYGHWAVTAHGASGTLFLWLHEPVEQVECAADQITFLRCHELLTRPDTSRCAIGRSETCRM